MSKVQRNLLSFYQASSHRLMTGMDVLLLHIDVHFTIIRLSHGGDHSEFPSGYVCIKAVVGSSTNVMTVVDELEPIILVITQLLFLVQTSSPHLCLKKSHAGFSVC